MKQRKIALNRDYLGFNYYIINLLKINEYRFILIYPNTSNIRLFLVVFDINEPPNIALLIRYYFIQLNIYESQIYFYLECRNYNGFISLIYTIRGETEYSPILLFFFYFKLYKLN